MDDDGTAHVASTAFRANRLRTPRDSEAALRSTKNLGRKNLATQKRTDAETHGRSARNDPSAFEDSSDGLEASVPAPRSRLVGRRRHAFGISNIRMALGALVEAPAS